MACRQDLKQHASMTIPIHRFPVLDVSSSLGGKSKKTDGRPAGVGWTTRISIIKLPVRRAVFPVSTAQGSRPTVCLAICQAGWFMLGGHACIPPYHQWPGGPVPGSSTWLAFPAATCQPQTDTLPSAKCMPTLLEPLASTLLASVSQNFFSHIKRKNFQYKNTKSSQCYKTIKIFNKVFHAIKKLQLFIISHAFVSRSPLIKVFACARTQLVLLLQQVVN